MNFLGLNLSNASRANHGRLAVGLCLLLLGTGSGCNQNPAGRSVFPWAVNPPAANAATNPLAANAAAPGVTAPAANPAYTPNGPVARLLQRRNGYISEMQRRANDQARLAEEQQARLKQLRELQLENDQQLAELRGKQQRSREAELLKRSERDQQLATRARAALGRYGEVERRAQGLDRNNAELHARVAQIQQQKQLVDDQNDLLRRRLEETSQQLAAAIESTQQNQAQMQTMMASARRRGGAAITANNSYRRNLTAVSVPGLSVRQDGELVRIELPSDRIFETGTARLASTASPLLDQVAGVILKNYPRQIVGVEAHTDNSPLSETLWRNGHQLTAAQAMSVFEHLSYRHQLLPQQLFVLGHGQNYPLASNATTAGQARNRRVEIVIYPEQVGQR